MLVFPVRHGAEWRWPFLACPSQDQKYARPSSGGLDTAPDYLFDMTLDLPYSRRKVLESEGPVKLRCLHSSPGRGPQKHP